MRKVLRGALRAKMEISLKIGGIPVPHSKDKPSPRERQDKRHLIRQGATIFKKEVVRSSAHARPVSGSKPLGG